MTELHGRDIENESESGAPSEDPSLAAASPEVDESAYRVSVPAFEGPLDLLLHLIRKNQLDIYDIPISLITDQYNQYLDAMKEMNVEVAADFIYMAALLIHIKSKMLLPRREEGDPHEDPRQELVDRLLEHQRFKAVAETFAELDTVRTAIWSRPASPAPGLDPAEVDLGEVSLFDLIDAFRSALVRYKVNHPQAIHIVRPAHKVSDKMREMTEQLGERSPIRLFWFLEGRDRAELVAIFLAILELVRLGGILLRQSEAFGEIEIHRGEKTIDATQFAAYD